MNSMCDLTQFVFSSTVRNINAEVLANTFMVDVSLSFGMTAVVVVDADSKFRIVFLVNFHCTEDPILSFGTRKSQRFSC